MNTLTRLILAASLLCSSTAFAAATTWTLTSPAFLTGSVSGTFDFDPDTGTYSNIALVAQNLLIPGAVALDQAGSVYDILDPDCLLVNPLTCVAFEVTSDATQLIARSSSRSDEYYVAFLFAQPLTDPAEETAITASQAVWKDACTGLSDLECFLLQPDEFDLGDGGLVTPSTVPIPAAGYLFLSALLGLVLRKRIAGR